jgi:Ca2+-binding RTX toxin-like protein
MTQAGTRRAIAATIAVVAVGAVPAPALGAEAHVETIDGVKVIVFNAAPGEVQSVLVDRDPGFTNDQYQLEDQNNRVTAGPGCQNPPRTPFAGVEEKIVRCDASATTIRVNLADGKDTVRFGKLNGNLITDVVDGGEGDDSLDTSNGSGLIMGGPGDDTIDANAGDDEVIGGDDDDSIVGGPGSDTISGDAGNDKIRGHATPDTQEIGTVTDFRAGDVNKLAGGPGNDTIVGDNGTDEILGDAGNDTLAGAGAADILDGGAGNDTIDEGDTPGDPNGGQPGGPLAPDTIRGGAGTDTATYCTRHYSDSEARKHPLTITLDNKANDGEKGEGDQIGPKGDVENVLGGGVTNDKITGNARANQLVGDCLSTFTSSGDNKLYGGGGNDKLVGSDGRDLLNGGKGADSFLGNEDADTIQAKDGKRDKSINCDGIGAKSSSDSATLDRSDPTPFNCDKLRR